MNQTEFYKIMTFYLILEKAHGDFEEINNRVILYFNYDFIVHHPTKTG